MDETRRLPMLPGMLLAIDPGADTGWAFFDSCRRLTSCGLGDPVLEAPAPSRVLIECPKLRPRGEKNPNAILLVARGAGEYAGAYRSADVSYLTPNDWKGSTPKDISNARTWAKLDPKEQETVDRFFRGAPGRNGLAPSRRHNVLDAIGIGLFGVGR